MAGEIEICNVALAELGVPPIAAFTDNTIAAKTCATLWPFTRDEILRSHPWNCAVKRVSLAPKSGTPVMDFTYAFTMPSDCLRVLSVGEASVYNNGSSTEWRTEGRDILYDGNPLYLRYIYRNEDAVSYDTLLQSALALSMQMKLAYPLTKSTSLAESLRGRLADIMRAARTTDAQEDPSPIFGAAPFITVRS